MEVVRRIYLLATNTEFFGVCYDQKKMSDANIIAELSKNPDVLFFGNTLAKLEFCREINYFGVSNSFAKSSLANHNYIIFLSPDFRV